jgi:hypothetical protein
MSSLRTRNQVVNNRVWNNAYGEDAAKGICYGGCGKLIHWQGFEAGHIVAHSKGGLRVPENLRPVCGPCNKSMGNKDMVRFLLMFKLSSPLLEEPGMEYKIWCTLHEIRLEDEKSSERKSESKSNSKVKKAGNYCSYCDHEYASKAGLAKHLLTPKHRKNSP